MMVEAEAVVESEDPVQRFGSNYVDITFRDFLSSMRVTEADARHGAQTQSMYLNVQNLKPQGQVLSDFLAVAVDFSTSHNKIPRMRRVLFPW